MKKYNKVLLEQGRLASYLPIYVEGKKFFNIIEDTLKIFGEMENFYYKYFQNSEDSC